MMEIPTAYTTYKFLSLTDNATKSGNKYVASCPICNEGKSSYKKKRLYYFIDDQYMYCHNCGESWTPYHFIKKASGMTFKEILDDIRDYVGDDSYDNSYVINNKKFENSTISESNFSIPPLPMECVDLKNDVQREYYSKNKIIKIADEYCTSRRLYTAINSPITYFVCVEDKFHKNRLIIPYYDHHGNIISYSSRKLLDYDTKAKYLIKANSNKPIFNFHKIDFNYPYIFIFEGALDCIFVKNGIAISGIHMTSEQEKLINDAFPFHEQIWCLDNYRFEDKNVVDKIKDKIQSGNRVFLYNDEFSEFKDMNEYCIKKNLDCVNPDLIINDSYSGNRALLKMH
jgi:CHC2 zinc finger/DNA primase catalytic core, N-terminal domain